MNLVVHAEAVAQPRCTIPANFNPTDSLTVLHVI
jgi:hypothetical protein